MFSGRRPSGPSPRSSNSCRRRTASRSPASRPSTTRVRPASEWGLVASAMAPVLHLGSSAGRLGLRCGGSSARGEPSGRARLQCSLRAAPRLHWGAFPFCQERLPPRRPCPFSAPACSPVLDRGAHPAQASCVQEGLRHGHGRRSCRACASRLRFGGAFRYGAGLSQGAVAEPVF